MDALVVLLLWTTAAVALAAGYSVGDELAPVSFAERLAHFLPFSPSECCAPSPSSLR